MLANVAKQLQTQAPKAARGIHQSAKRLSGDGHHQHYVFEGEFSKAWARGLFTLIVGGGVGVPVFLLKYQNWKNGFPREE